MFGQVCWCPKGPSFELHVVDYQCNLLSVAVVKYIGWKQLGEERTCTAYTYKSQFCWRKSRAGSPGRDLEAGPMEECSLLAPLPCLQAHAQVAIYTPQDTYLGNDAAQGGLSINNQHNPHRHTHRAVWSRQLLKWGLPLPGWLKFEHEVYIHKITAHGGRGRRIRSSVSSSTMCTELKASLGYMVLCVKAANNKKKKNKKENFSFGSLLIFVLTSFLFSHLFFLLSFFFFFLELRTEPRALRLLGKHSITELNPQPPSFSFLRQSIFLPLSLSPRQIPSDPQSLTTNQAAVEPTTLPLFCGRVSQGNL